MPNRAVGSGHADASPVPLPVCDVPGMFFLMLFFCGYRACYCSSSFSSSLLSVPLLFMAFPGVPLAGRLS